MKTLRRAREVVLVGVVGELMEGWKEVVRGGLRDVMRGFRREEEGGGGAVGRFEVVGVGAKPSSSSSSSNIIIKSVDSLRFVAFVVVKAFTVLAPRLIPVKSSARPNGSASATLS